MRIKRTENSKAVGNEPPVVHIALKYSNQSFWFSGDRIQYEVSVKDKEDGNTHDGDIGEGKVKMNIDFVKEDVAELVDLNSVLKNEDVLLPVELSVGRYLLNNNDCNICHRMDTKLMGPSFDDIGKKYGTKPDGRGYLAGKIINGSVGIWGEEAMPPHPAITMKEAELIAGYLLQHRTGTTKSKPLKGTVVIDDMSKNDGRYILRASYLDRDNGAASRIETIEVRQLKSPKIGLVKADEISGIILKHHIGRKPTAGTAKGDGYFKFENIDLTRIDALEVEVNLAGMAENEKPEFKFFKKLV